MQIITKTHFQQILLSIEQYKTSYLLFITFIFFLKFNFYNIYSKNYFLIHYFCQ